MYAFYIIITCSRACIDNNTVLNVIAAALE